MSSDERRVFGYIRVSTLDQADSGLGLEAQRRAIRSECDARWTPKGYAFGGVYEDAATSGAKEFRSRLAGLRLCNEVRNGDVIVFSKLDRAFRNTIDALVTVRSWQERGVRVVFLDLGIDTSTAAGEMMLTVMSSFATMERRRIGERTKEALAEVKRKGKRLGPPPMTIKVLKDGGKQVWTVRPDILALGEKVVGWRRAGHSWYAIYSTLRDAGVERKGVKSPLLRIKHGLYWSMPALRRLYRQTLNTLLWIEEGRVKMPAAKREHPPEQRVPEGVPVASGGSTPE